MFRRLAVFAVVLLLILGAASSAQEKKPPAKPLYPHGLDSKEQEDVPKGKVTKMPVWKSKVFAGTERDWWIYVPAQYDGKEPACMMVFQDGGWYVDTKADFRVPTVFDNLIHKK